MATIQQRFDELGEVIAGLRSRVFDLTNRLAKIVEHPDTPELIRQYARGQIGSRPVAPIDGTGWAEAAFVDDVDPAHRQQWPFAAWGHNGPMSQAEYERLCRPSGIMAVAQGRQQAGSGLAMYAKSLDDLQSKGHPDYPFRGQGE